MKIFVLSFVLLSFLSVCSQYSSDSIVNTYSTANDADGDSDGNPVDTANGESADTRLIYFLHGLGGNNLSWDAVDDAHMHLFKYMPVKPDYEFHQRDFHEASYEVSLDMDDERRDALKNESITTDPPYVIAHSQGGLVARDMDRKFFTGFSTRFQEKNRQFYGLVTFGTPHLGARIAVANTELLDFSSQMCDALTNSFLRQELATFTLKAPIYLKVIDRLEQSVSMFNAILCDDLVVTGIDLLSKGQQAKITQHYGPTSAYLKGLNQFSNPNLAKAAFYGVEEDPILWRLATYLVGADPHDQVKFDRFGANLDDSIARNMDDLRLKLKAMRLDREGDLDDLLYRRSKTWFRKRLLDKQITIVRATIKAHSNGIMFIHKSNDMYKSIIGAIDNTTTKKVIAFYACRSNTSNRVKLVANPTQCTNGIAVPIYRYRSFPHPSDGVVLARSQQQFPGCHPMHIHPLNEVMNYSGDGWTRQKVKEAVNHMQMRNCLQTDAALRRIYTGNGVPRFFKLPYR